MNVIHFNSILSSDSEITVNAIYFKYTSVTLKNKVYGSSGKKSTPFVALAMWDKDLYGSPSTSHLLMTPTVNQSIFTTS